MPFAFRTAALASVLALAAWACPQGDPATIERIAHEAKERSRAMALLEHLALRIGPRLTGTARLQRAERWAAERFRSWGLRNVELVQWGELPYSFERGPRAWGRMTEPIAREFAFSTPAWTWGTPGPVRAEAVWEPTPDELERDPERFRGRWIVMRERVAMHGARPARPARAIETRLEEIGVAGLVFGSQNLQDWVHTHGWLPSGTIEEVARTPRIAIRASDYRSLARQLERERVVLEFDIPQRLIPGPVPLHNVVAEIPGTERPDEMVVVGAHLDSWDGWGSQGASDNGTGVVTVLEAARALAAAGARPKRTIRFILWTGEEQGLLGARADVDMLRAAGRLDKVSAVINEDGGSNRQAAIGGLAIWQSFFERALADINRVYPEWPVAYRVIERWEPRLAGSDHAAYAVAGVPAFAWGKAGEQVYGRIWHTQHDRLEEVIPRYVVQMATNTALLAYNLACADEMLPRPPAPPAQTDAHAPAIFVRRR